MKYFSANASVVTVRVRDGHWSDNRQAKYLAGKLVWLFDLKDLGFRHESQYITLEQIISDYLIGSADADKILRTSLTSSAYRIMSEVASFIAADHVGSNAPDAYLAIDLNSGRNLVLRPR